MEVFNDGFGVMKHPEPTIVGAVSACRAVQTALPKPLRAEQECHLTSGGATWPGREWVVTSPQSLSPPPSKLLLLLAMD